MLRVLTYHRLSTPEANPGLDPRNISASPRAFEQQMRLVRDHFSVVPLERVVAAVECGEKLPARPLLLTFDDGYRDFLECAWPVLTKLSLPATLFVPTAFPDHPEREFWCDRLYRAFMRSPKTAAVLEGLGTLTLDGGPARLAALRRVQARLKTLDHRTAEHLVERACEELGVTTAHGPSVLGWDELRALAREGLAVGAHSRSHALMTRLPAPAVRDEIEGSLSDLGRELGPTQPVYCYPSGAHDDATVRIAREAGVRVAFTTADGHNRIGTVDPLRLRRTNVTPRTTPLLLRLRLSRLGAVVDRLRHRARAA